MTGWAWSWGTKVRTCNSALCRAAWSGSVRPEELRDPTRAEAMSAKVAVANGRWGL